MCNPILQEADVVLMVEMELGCVCDAEGAEVRVIVAFGVHADVSAVVIPVEDAGYGDLVGELLGHLVGEVIINE